MTDVYNVVLVLCFIIFFPVMNFTRSKCLLLVMIPSSGDCAGHHDVLSPAGVGLAAPLGPCFTAKGVFLPMEGRTAIADMAGARGLSGGDPIPLSSWAH